MQRLEHEWTRAIERIPTAEKAAYLEAQQKCPTLIETESNPEWFLRIENGNIDAAALRHVNYWEQRHSTFQERAFHSLLDLSGSGALNDADIRMLKSGLLVNLPPDEAGRPVALTDLSLCEVKSKAEARSTYFRVQLYNCLINSMNPMAQKDGIVGLRVVTDTQFSPEMIKQSTKMMAKCYPQKLYAYHICCLPNGKTNVAAIVAPALLKTFRDVMPDWAHLHVGSSGEEILPKLVSHGLKRSGLPSSLGGDWVLRQEALFPLAHLDIAHAQTKRAARQVSEASHEIGRPRASDNCVEDDHIQADLKVRKAVDSYSEEPSKRRKQLHSESPMHSVISTSLVSSSDIRPGTTNSFTIKAQIILNALRKAGSVAAVSSVRELLARPDVRMHLADLMMVHAPYTNAALSVKSENKESSSLGEAMEMERVKNRLLKKLTGAVHSGGNKFRQIRKPFVTISPLRNALLARIRERLRASADANADNMNVLAPSLQHGPTTRVSVLLRAIKTMKQQSGCAVREMFAKPRFVARVQAHLVPNHVEQACDPMLADTPLSVTESLQPSQIADKDSIDAQKKRSKTQILTLLLKRLKTKPSGLVGVAGRGTLSRRSAMHAALSSRVVQILQERKP